MSLDVVDSSPNAINTILELDVEKRTKHWQYDQISLIWKVWRPDLGNWNFRDQNHSFVIVGPKVQLSLSLLQTYS